VDLQRVTSLEQPLDMAVRPNDDHRYFAEKTGLVVALLDGRTRPVLDLTNQVSLGSEQGLLGITFSPNGGLLYVDYTDTAGDTRVESYVMDGDHADPSSRREVLFVDQPFSNHNGGEVTFGPDGDLYVGLGDGGSGGDPLGNGQSLSTLLGKILRISPRSTGARPYAIPAGNPFVEKAGDRPEIWAYGLRNPWRFSFDRQTGDLWIGDVGQSAWEEIDRQRAGSPGGVDYGWNVMEGNHPYAEGSTQGLETPVYEYPHSQGRCVVTGGYVYRGTDIPGLVGWYVFGDFCTGRLEAIRILGGTVQHQYLGPTVPNLSSFGEDASGELYAMSLSGPVYRLVP
jgi:glucose/arabinose dehydrogenase